VRAASVSLSRHTEVRGKALETGLALSGLQFLGGAPIAPALSPVHRHGPQEDKDDPHKAADYNPIDDVAREKVHGRILARGASMTQRAVPRAGGPIDHSQVKVRPRSVSIHHVVNGTAGTRRKNQFVISRLLECEWIVAQRCGDVSQISARGMPRIS
jgi:hypothetical protein